METRAECIQQVVLTETISNLAEVPKVYEKPWGVSVALVACDEVDIDLIHVKQGGYSSLHEHLHKHNLFMVTSGSLKITTYDRRFGQFEECGQFVLTPERGILKVDAHRLHKFTCLADCSAYEVYWPSDDEAVRRSDIVRYEPNGVARVHPPKLPK